jgi:hypothetical protein
MPANKTFVPGDAPNIVRSLTIWDTDTAANYYLNVFQFSDGRPRFCSLGADKQGFISGCDANDQCMKSICESL